MSALICNHVTDGVCTACHAEQLDAANAEIERLCAELATARKSFVGAMNESILIRTLERMANEANWNEEDCLLKREHHAGEQHGIFLYSWGVKPWIVAKQSLDAIRALKREGGT